MVQVWFVLVVVVLTNDTSRKHQKQWELSKTWSALLVRRTCDAHGAVLVVVWPTPSRHKYIFFLEVGSLQFTRTVTLRWCETQTQNTLLHTRILKGFPLPPSNTVLTEALSVFLTFSRRIDMSAEHPPPQAPMARAVVLVVIGHARPT